MAPHLLPLCASVNFMPRKHWAPWGWLYKQFGWLWIFFFFLGNSINQAGSKIHLLQIDGNKWKIDNDHKCKQKNAEFPNVKRSIYLELVD